MPRMKINDIKRNDETGEKEATMMVTNSAVKFLKEAVNMYTQHKCEVAPDGFGDTDDVRKNEIIQEVESDLHQAWKELNPS
jgi:hypothetical protein